MYIYNLYIKELIIRSLYIFIYFIIFLFIFLFYYKEIYSILTISLLIFKKNNFHGFISTNFIELFYINLYGACIFGIFMTIPYISRHCWGFLKMALTFDEQWRLFNIIKLFNYFYILGSILTIFILIPLSWFFFVYEDVNFILIQPRIDIFLFYFFKILCFSLILFQTPIFYFFLLSFNLINYKYSYINIEITLFSLFIFIYLLSSIDFIIGILSLIPLFILYEIIFIYYLLNKFYFKNE